MSSPQVWHRLGNLVSAAPRVTAVVHRSCSLVPQLCKPTCTGTSCRRVTIFLTEVPKTVAASILSKLIDKGSPDLVWESIVCLSIVAQLGGVVWLGGGEFEQGGQQTRFSSPDIV